MMAGLARLGLLGWEVVGVSVLGVIPVAAGIRAGAGLRRHLSEERFRNAVLVLMLALGVNLVVNA